MADAKISELPAAESLGGDEPLPVVQGAPLTTVRATPRAIAVYAAALRYRPLINFGG